jgi:parallel beta helix pectate lyase-like protein
VDCTGLGADLGKFGYKFTLTAQVPVNNDNDFGNHFAQVTCNEDKLAVCTQAVDANLKAHGGLPVFATIGAAYNAANNGDTICIFTDTTENVVLDDDRTLKITQCSNATVTAADDTKPVWNITSTGQLTIVGPDSVGGTIGWRVETNDHTLSSVRATKASEQGILVLGTSNHISWNEIDHNGVGIRVEGSSNDLRGGTVDKNTGDGIQFGPTATGNLLQGATVQNNGGNGIVVEGSSNTIQNNPRVDKNGLNGIQVTGAGNTVKGNTVGSGKGKGNGLAGTPDQQDGIQVTGNGNTLDSNKVSANAGDGVDVSGGTIGSPNVLKGNQSNVGASHGAKENKGAEYRLLDTITNLGGNKADGKNVPTATKCPDFPVNNTTVTFSPNPEVCE